ncbi:MAG: metallophosphoesterase [Peptostreptococcaceae bacterium]
MISEILIGSTVLLGGYAFYKYETEALEKVEYIIEDEKIPKEFDNFNIVQISDLHNSEFGKNNQKLLEAVDELKPDILVITGDLVDGEKNNYQVALNLVDILSKKYKIYHIIGNHEQKSLVKKYKQQYKKYFEQLYDKNIINLDNEVVKIHKGDSYINLYGLVVPLNCYKYLFDKKNKTILEDNFIEDKLGKIDKGTYNILLSHTPFYFEEYSNWGADLILSGHVHGGIIRIPYIGGLLSPNREFFPKYDFGKYEKENSTMLLTKGLGGSKVLLRINCRPEVVKITLKSKNI